MFIKLFRSDISFQLILLIIIGLLLWLPGIISPPAIPQSKSLIPLFEFLTIPLEGLPRLASAIGLFLVLTEGIILSQILSNNGLSQKNSAFPAIIYVLLISWHPATLTLHPLLPANAFLIFFLYSFLNVYEKKDALKEVFSSAFAISLASLFHFHLAALILVIWFGFFVFRVFSWREWIISLIGLSLPYALALGLMFVLDRLVNPGELLNTLLTPQYFLIDSGVFINTAWGLLGFLLLASLLRILGRLQEKVITVRKNFLFVTWFFLLSLPIVFLSGTSGPYVATAALLPGSVLLAYHLGDVRHLLWWEIIFSLFVILLILVRIP